MAPLQKQSFFYQDKNLMRFTFSEKNLSINFCGGNDKINWPTLIQKSDRSSNVIGKAHVCENGRARGNAPRADGNNEDPPHGDISKSE